MARRACRPGWLGSGILACEELEDRRLLTAGPDGLPTLEALDTHLDESSLAAVSFVDVDSFGEGEVSPMAGTDSPAPQAAPAAYTATSPGIRVARPADSPASSDAHSGLVRQVEGTNWIEFDSQGHRQHVDHVTWDTNPNADALVTVKVLIHDHGGTAPEKLARFQDAIAEVNSAFENFGVLLRLVTVTDGSQNIHLHEDSTSGCGGTALGCAEYSLFVSHSGTFDDGHFNHLYAGEDVGGRAEATMLSGFNWYTGANPGLIGSSQYDFQTVATQELLHLVGLDHDSTVYGSDPETVGNTDRRSVMHGTLGQGIVRRLMSTHDQADMLAHFYGQTSPSATPGGVTLAAVSDTGASNSDQIAKLNNSSPGVALQFDVPGTVAGATVTLFADGTPIGSAVAGGSTTTVTTDGSTVLADGLRNLTARQTEPGKPQSGDTAPLAVGIDTQAPQATLVSVTPDPRNTPVAQMTITFDEPVSGLELVDLSLTLNAGSNLLSGAQVVTSGDGITWTLADLSGITATPGFYELVMSPAGAPLADLAGNVNANVESTSFTVSSTVLGRFLFYNDSAFDGNDATIEAGDAAAIAPDKSPLLPGAGQATLANLTNYTRGINGIMIDLSSGVDHGGITLANVANNFVFKVGANNSPNLWDPAPAPSAISVTPGGGVSGSDRVTITWASGAIVDTYLEVQVLSTAQTGLADTDVFFWGNLIGETTDTTPTGAFARTVAADRGPILSGGTQINVGITSHLDINKSNAITVAADGGPILTAGTGLLPRISIASAGPFAPEGDDGGEAGIASAMASTSTSSTAASSLVTTALPRGIGNRLQTLDLNSGRIAAFFQYLADQDTPGTRKLLTRIDAVAEELGLEHELLDDLVAGLVL